MSTVERQSGKVLWFNDAKGFGFIEADAGGPHVFITWRDIDVQGFATLAIDDRVTFELEHSPKGLTAKKLRVFGKAQAPSIPPGSGMPDQDW